jgi:hypothetical protein
MLRAILWALVCVSIAMWGSLALAETQDLQQQILTKYGNVNGDLDDNGIRRLLRDVRNVRKRGAHLQRQIKPVTTTVPQPNSPKAQPGPTFALPTLSELFAGPDCIPDQKALFVRADPLDNFHYLVDPSTAADAKGASVSYTDNRVTGTQNVTAAVRRQNISNIRFGKLREYLAHLV